MDTAFYGGADGAMPNTSEHRGQPFTAVLTFDYATPPLHANKRLHHMAHARITKDIRRATELKAARLPALGKIRVQLVWVVKDHRRRDGGENLAPTVKPMLDGLVDAGVVFDDAPKYVDRKSSIVEYQQGCTPHMELRIEMVS